MMMMMMMMMKMTMMVMMMDGSGGDISVKGHLILPQMLGDLLQLVDGVDIVGVRAGAV